jgi:hypothetical protein
MREPLSGGKPAAKKTPMSASAINRRTNEGSAKKTVVSQAVINQIKKDGMTAALKKSAGGASAAYKEGVKRMYGTKRATAAVVASMKPKTKPASGPDAARAAAMKPKAVKKAAAPKYTSPDAARRGR